MPLLYTSPNLTFRTRGSLRALGICSTAPNPEDSRTQFAGRPAGWPQPNDVAAKHAAPKKNPCTDCRLSANASEPFYTDPVPAEGCEEGLRKVLNGDGAQVAQRRSQPHKTRCAPMGG